MSKIVLTPGGAEFVAEMLASCGNKACDEAIVRLARLRKPAPLSDFWIKGDAGWLKPVFGNLQAYALGEAVSTLDVEALALYFGGRYHISHMIRKATRSNLTYLMGPDAGLILDVLLPLTDNHYTNAGVTIEFSSFVESWPDRKGTRCFHRGLVVILPITRNAVEQILSEQRDSPEFMKALRKVKSPIKLPLNFIKALNDRH